MNNCFPKKGFTLIETIIAIGIFVAISTIIWIFGKDIFFFNSSLNSSLSTQFDSRQILKKFVSEVRSASPSSLGSYPISIAGTSTISFFSDIDNDLVKEQVRYYLSGNEIKRGVIKPTGNPLTYNPANENVSTVVHYVVNGVTPIFEYFDENYTGTSSPLTQPVNLMNVRFVRVTILIDKDPARPPAMFTASTQVMLRNLKDNL